MAEDKTDAHNVSKTLRILCFGDSLTAGYTKCGWEHYPYAAYLRSTLELMLPSTEIKTEVAGLSGDQVRGQYLKRIKARCPITSERRYDWIIIMGGTNDLGWGREPEPIYEDLTKVWRIALDTGANVLALNVLEVASSSPKLIQKRDKLNTMIKDHKADRFYTFDLCDAIPYAMLDREAREALWDDGLHLTKQGYDVMGNVIADRLFEILQETKELKSKAEAI